MDIDIPRTILLLLCIFAPVGITYVINQYFGWPWKPEGYHRRRRHDKRRFRLAVIFKKQNKLTMALNSTTLTTTTPVTGEIVLFDEFGNEYTGTLSNPQLSISDPALDEAQIDPANANNLIVTAKGPDGTDSVNLSGDWTSQGNTTSRPNSDPSKPASKVLADGLVLTGVKCTVQISNDITRQFVLGVKLP